MTQQPNHLVPAALAAKMEEWRRDAKPWKPWPYQELGLKFMLEDSQCGLLLDPGMGKTSTSLAAIKVLLKKKLITRALVVAPLRAIYDVWPQEMCDWKDFHDLRLALLHGGNKEKLLRALTPEHQVILINPEGLQWLMADLPRMKQLGAEMLIVDECFAAGTLVTTPIGPVAVELLKVGNVVCTEEGERIINSITSREPTGGVVEVKLNGLAQSIRCTEDHPFFTELGWLPAKCLTGRRVLCLDTLRDMQESKVQSISSNFGKGNRPYLRVRLRGEMVSVEAPRSRLEYGEKCAPTLQERMAGKKRRHTKATFKVEPECGEGQLALCEDEMQILQEDVQDTTSFSVTGYASCLLEILQAEVGLEDGRWNLEKDCKRNDDTLMHWQGALEQGEVLAERILRTSFEVGEGQQSYLLSTRWERPRTFACGDSGTKLSAEEVYLQLRSSVGEGAAWLSYELQSRLWRAEQEDSVGGRRRQSSSWTSKGREERRQIEGTRVESVSYLKPGSVSVVYNLEVEGCPHFEVAGCALVHNSSKFKSGTSLRFRVMRRHLRSFARRHILTGSPRPKNYIDLWSQIYLLDQGVALGAYVSHYRNQFFFPTGFEMREWELLPDSEKQINALIAPMVLRLDAKDYLKLPSVPPDRIHKVALPPAARKEYDKIEDTLMSTLFTAPLVSSAAARSKCCQVANGAVYTDQVVDDRWPTKQRPVKTIHSAKVDAVVDLYEELQGEPLLLSIGYHHDVAAIRAALGKDIPCINGETTRTQSSDFITRWNKGQLSLMMIHPASAGHGLNLQGCSCRHVGFFYIPDDYDHYDQLFRRVWRQGNKAQFVFRHLFVAENTVDVPKLANLRHKGTGQRDFLNAMRDYAEQRYGKGGKKK